MKSCAASGLSAVHEDPFQLIEPELAGYLVFVAALLAVIFWPYF